MRAHQVQSDQSLREVAQRSVVCRGQRSVYESSCSPTKAHLWASFATLDEMVGII
jgi:hypothetical protein